MKHYNMDNQAQYSSQIFMFCQNWRLNIKRSRAWNMSAWETIDPASLLRCGRESRRSIWVSVRALLAWSATVSVSSAACPSALQRRGQQEIRGTQVTFDARPARCTSVRQPPTASGRPASATGSKKWQRTTSCHQLGRKMSVPQNYCTCLPKLTWCLSSMTSYLAGLASLCR